MDESCTQSAESNRGQCLDFYKSQSSQVFSNTLETSLKVEGLKNSNDEDDSFGCESWRENTSRHIQVWKIKELWSSDTYV